MKQQELAAIMADPKAAPDSDDEEDIEEWKVGLHFSCPPLPKRDGHYSTRFWFSPDGNDT